MNRGTRDQLFNAVYGRNADAVEALLRSDAALSAEDMAYAMRVATTRGHEEIVRVFLGSGVDCNLRETDGSTPLMWAAAAGRKQPAEMFLAAGADVNASDTWSWTALFHAAAAQHAEIVELLLRAGADTTRRDVEGYTAAERARYRRRNLKLPLLGSAAVQYPTLFETPTRAILRRHEVTAKRSDASR